ncbi:DUF3560 domain-containing protein [Chryseobacterium viscerum]|uniref:DUF3560 domain-containing protein n=1 Tax=Chryseobacterium viscerum TaxID=1037377 RepID=A0A5N4BJ44_9FLAO|nr:DUF3560 domain-containing protein [Chryseobacterium viscerum]KAB1228466.1 DUF3560 domain-containing protein [Chryseobacterium viscerum]
MNTYSKYVPNVFLAKCTERHSKGEIINVTTKYGKENESEVYNLIYEKDDFFYYSIVRADGFNIQERAKAKAERYESWASAADKKSTDHYNRSKDLVKHIPMGQPILVGHHSEAGHRRTLDRSWSAMGKSVELSDKASSHENKADYWAKRASEINLSMPESIEYYEYKLEVAKERHEGLKSGKYERSHSYSLTYAKKDVNEAQKNLDLSKKLWS